MSPKLLPKSLSMPQIAISTCGGTPYFADAAPASSWSWSSLPRPASTRRVVTTSSMPAARAVSRKRETQSAKPAACTGSPEAVAEADAPTAGGAAMPCGGVSDVVGDIAGVGADEAQAVTNRTTRTQRRRRRRSFITSVKSDASKPDDTLIDKRPHLGGQQSRMRIDHLDRQRLHLELLEDTFEFP